MRGWTRACLAHECVQTLLFVISLAILETVVYYVFASAIRNHTWCAEPDHACEIMLWHYRFDMGSPLSELFFVLLWSLSMILVAWLHYLMCFPGKLSRHSILVSVAACVAIFTLIVALNYSVVQLVPLSIMLGVAELVSVFTIGLIGFVSWHVCREIQEKVDDDLELGLLKQAQ
jgi:hypothetical protein